ncbi:MAG: hypothetical protein ACLQGV_12685 [Bryobacteraceae bacterium]
MEIPAQSDDEVRILPLQIRADFLKSAVLEDRTEVRLLRDRIYQLSAFITVSSFAITAFLIRPENSRLKNGPLLLGVDVAFLALLWVAFARLKIDLRNARKCLEGREDMIRALGTDKEPVPFDPYPSFEAKAKAKAKPKMSDRDVFWILAFATVALLLKLAIVVGFVKP